MKILLLNRDDFFIADTSQKKFQTQYGDIELAKARIGKKIRSSKGKEFMALQPTILDLLRKAKRGPQIITPKDAASIVSVTGVSSGWRCADAGSGSGFLSIFLGNLVRPGGKIYTYEIDKRNYEVVRRNIEYCSLGDTVKAENRDIRKGIRQKNLDLVTLDMQHADKVVKSAYNSLKPGGWLCVYSPQIEQQIKCMKEMQKLFTQIKTIENIQREWKVDPRGFTHPIHSQVVHTGFMTFGRKAL